MALSSPHLGENFKKAGAFFEPLKAHAQDVPNMTVKVNPGGYWVNESTYVEFTGGNSPPLTAPPSNSKWVYVTLRANGTLENLNGTPSVSPVPPTVPNDGRMTLCAVFMSVGTTAVTNAMISDNRPLFNVGNAPVSHVSVINRVHADAHDIGSITGLSADLANKVDLTTFNNALTLKADIDGTPNLDFILNKDEVGVPTNNVSVIVERGSSSNVSIRWNETADIWEFTNDGTVFNPVGAAAGSYTISQSDGAAGTPGAKINKVIPAVAGNFASLIAGGELVDSGKNNASYVAAVSPATAGRLPTLTAAGQLVDSGVLLSSVALLTNVYTILQVDTLLDDKQDNLVPAIVGTVAILDSNGHIDETSFLPTDWVLKSGSTMTGALTLFGPPTLPLHAATKAYVDAIIAAPEDHMDYAIRVGSGVAVYSTAPEFTFTAPVVNKEPLLVFVNGIKQIRGPLKAYTISAPSTVTFNAGSEPAVLDDVEFYGLG